MTDSQIDTLLGFIITPLIREKLQKSCLTQDLKKYADNEVHFIPFKSLVDFVANWNNQQNNEKLYLHELVQGSKLTLPEQKTPPLTPAELAKREKFRLMAANQEYYNLVKDIEPKNNRHDDTKELRAGFKEAAIPLNMLLTTVAAFIFVYLWLRNRMDTSWAAGIALAASMTLFMIEGLVFILRHRKIVSEEQNKAQGPAPLIISQSPELDPGYTPAELDPKSKTENKKNK